MSYLGCQRLNIVGMLLREYERPRVRQDATREPTEPSRLRLNSGETFPTAPARTLKPIETSDYEPLQALIQTSSETHVDCTT